MVSYYYELCRIFIYHVILKIIRRKLWCTDTTWVALFDTYKNIKTIFHSKAHFQSFTVSCASVSKRVYVKPFWWKRAWFTWKWTHRENSFSHRLVLTQVKGYSEMVYCHIWKFSNVKNLKLLLQSYNSFVWNIWNWKRFLLIESDIDIAKGEHAEICLVVFSLVKRIT